MADRTDALFVEGLKAIDAGLHKTGGTKKRDRVIERLGRLEQKTGTAHLNYDIHFEYDEHDTTTAITWKRKTERVEKQNKPFMENTSCVRISQRKTRKLFGTIIM